MIGRATAARLLSSGWEVDLTGREPSHLPPAIAEAGGRFVRADRDESSQLAAALGNGADLLVDCICYSAAQAIGLLPLARDVTSTVMISSRAVYADAAGRHFNSAISPRFGGPIRETQDTVPPADTDFRTRDGYGANKRAAELVLLDSGVPVTVLRPSKVHGASSHRPREWVFVKRALDHRPAVFLANHGKAVDHPTAAVNIASLIELVATRSGRRILNSADPDAPSALEISRTIARTLGHIREEVLLDGGTEEALGRHPWERPHPVVLDMTAAVDLGYTPVGDYARTVTSEVEWLVASAVQRGDGAELPPGLDAEFFEPFFDYAAEDGHLTHRA